MEEKYLKNSIISFFLIVSFILMPLSFLPKKAKASDITSILGGISEVITQLPLCQDALVGGIKSLFSKDTSSSTEDTTALGGELLTDVVKTAEHDSNGVQVILPEPTDKAIVNTDKKMKTIQNDIAATKNNDTCLQSIGRTVIKMLLQKITTDTVSWINGGMDGSPLFVENPGEYFKDIAKDEILGFAGEINDPTLYPFGKAFIESQANSFKSKFANNAQYSLNKMIYDTNPKYNAQTFSNDFSQGGWAAWDAMTQNAANNPLGFSLMASNELAKRIEDSTELAKGSLQMGSGYLGVQKCVNPEGVTKEEDDKARNGVDDGTNGPFRKCNQWNFTTPGQMVASAATKTINYPDNNLLAGDDLNDAVAAILDALLGSFSSSFMSEGGFAGLSDGTNTNFKSASEGNFVMNYENTSDYNSSQVGQDFSKFQISASSFLAQNPNFDIRTDLNQALIDEQRIFVDKIIQQNIELRSTITRTEENDPTLHFTGNYGLVPTIYQLDYCIPGPHPGFETDSRTALNAALSAIVPHDVNSIAEFSSEELASTVKTIVNYALMLTLAVVFASVGSIIPVIGTVVGAVVGAIVGYVIDLLFNDDDPIHNIRRYYAAIFEGYTNAKVEDNKVDGLNSDTFVIALFSFGAFSDAMNTILDRYIQIIYDVFDPTKMPSVTKEAAGKFLQVKGYNQIFTNNEARIISMQSLILRLGEIRTQIDNLNYDLSTVDKNGNPKEQTIKDRNGVIAPPEDIKDPVTGDVITLGQKSQYEENLKPWTSAFGRISQEMVTGDDIASVDNTTKQIIDEKDYIYNDLLKGPNGCEKDLELMKGVGEIGGLPWQIYATQRMSYPGPILYDYNIFKNYETLPDPYKSGYINKMPGDWGDTAKTPVPLNTSGPGFLSLVHWESSETPLWCGDGYKDTNISTAVLSGVDVHTPLCIQDLFDLRDWPSWIGKNPNSPGAFEMMIGVY